MISLHFPSPLLTQRGLSTCFFPLESEILFSFFISLFSIPVHPPPIEPFRVPTYEDQHTWCTNSLRDLIFPSSISSSPFLPSTLITFFGSSFLLVNPIPPQFLVLPELSRFLVQPVLLLDLLLPATKFYFTFSRGDPLGRTTFYFIHLLLTTSLLATTLSVLSHAPLHLVFG